MTYGRFAVIPTHNRPEHLGECIAAIQPHVERVFVIDNASSPPVSGPKGVVIIRDPQQPPNLSRLWNLGITAVERYADACMLLSWHTAILNDDTVPQPEWMEEVCRAMDETGAVAGCRMPIGQQRQVYGPQSSWGIGTRVSGWAFVLRGEETYRFDEDFKWWCGDDDLSVWARNNGGLVVTPGPEVPNLLANTSTVGVNLAQSALDMQHFVDKHGRRPW